MDQKINYNREDVMEFCAAIEKALSRGVPLYELVAALGNMTTRWRVKEEMKKHDNV